MSKTKKLAVIILSCLSLAVAARASADDFYANKRITIVVAFGAGGGIDAYARLLAAHLGAHIPGHPSVIVENMPGAAGISALTAMENSLPQDGTVVVAFNPAVVVLSVVSPDQYKINFSQMNWIGSADDDQRFCYMWGQTGVRTWDEFRSQKQIIMADSGGGASSIEQKILKRLLGVNLKQVFGYAGSRDKQLAVERGEVQGDCGAWTGTPVDWIRDKKINVIIRFERKVSDGLPESAAYAGDLIKGEDQQALFSLLMAGSTIGRPYVASENVPPDRVVILRKGFDETMQDPQFLKEATKANLSISPTPGVDLQSLVQRLYGLPKGIVQQAKDILLN